MKKLIGLGLLIWAALALQHWAPRLLAAFGVLLILASSADAQAPDPKVAVKVLTSGPSTARFVPAPKIDRPRVRVVAVYSTPGAGPFGPVILKERPRPVHSITFRIPRHRRER